MNNVEEVANNVALMTSQIIQQITNMQFKHFKTLPNKNVEIMRKLPKQIPLQMSSAPPNPSHPAPTCLCCKCPHCGKGKHESGNSKCWEIKTNKKACPDGWVSVHAMWYDGAQRCPN